jgi:hypothetical protein
VAACVHVLIRLHTEGIRGYCAIKQPNSGIKRRKQLQSGINLRQETEHKHWKGKRDELNLPMPHTRSLTQRNERRGVGQMGKNISVMRGVVWKTQSKVCARINGVDSKQDFGGISEWPCGQTRELRYLCFSIIPSWLSLSKAVSSHQTFLCS